MITFDALSENISGIDYNGKRFGKAIDGVSAWYHEKDYDTFIGSDYQPNGAVITVDGVEYTDHWFFVNEEHQSGVVGYSMLPRTGNGDVKFIIVGSKTDMLVSFDEMIDYLTCEAYFVE